MTFQRNLPPSAFKPKTLLAFGGLIMVYGWYHLFHGIREQRYLASTFSHANSLSLPHLFPFFLSPSLHTRRLTQPIILENSPARRCGPAST